MSPLESIDAFLEAGADPSAPSPFGTALEIAEKEGHPDAAKRLK